MTTCKEQKSVDCSSFHINIEFNNKGNNVNVIMAESFRGYEGCRIR